MGGQKVGNGWHDRHNLIPALLTSAAILTDLVLFYHLKSLLRLSDAIDLLGCLASLAWDSWPRTDPLPGREVREGVPIVLGGRARQIRPKALCNFQTPPQISITPSKHSFFGNLACLLVALLPPCFWPIAIAIDHHYSSNPPLCIWLFLHGLSRSARQCSSTEEC
jgi:hypothetical protein